MNAAFRVRQGTKGWVEMVGDIMREAAMRSNISPELTVSLVERYTDGASVAEGLVQGIRFDIPRGRLAAGSARPNC